MFLRSIRENASVNIPNLKLNGRVIHTETELIKLNQFTSKNDVIEYLLDTIYALEHPPMTP